MKATEFKIKVTNTKTNHSIIISLSDLKGYEGEDCGVFIDLNCMSYEDYLKMKVGNPMGWVKITNKSGYSPTEIDWDLLDFEHVNNGNT